MRYEVMAADSAVQQGIAGAEDYDYEWEPCDVLVDMDERRVVFADRMEPEDASLGRDLAPLVELLNHHAETSR